MSKILVVEDDSFIREALKKVIRALNYEVRTAENGQEGLQALKNESDIDLILSDIMMPILDGIEFRRKQLQDPGLKHIPVIFLTANSSFLDDIDDLQIYEFLNKPIDLEDLRRILDNFFMLQS